MGVRVQVIKDIYYLAVTHNGHRHYESLHMKKTGTKIDRELEKVAEMCRAKREMQLVCADYEIPDPTGSKMPLYDYMNVFAEGRGGLYINCMKYMIGYPGGTTIKLKDVTSEWLSGFQNYLLKADLQPGTVKNYMIAIRATLNQAVKERKIASNPARNLAPVTVPQTLKDILTLDEIKKLDSIPVGGDLGSEARRAFLFACFTGLRISDLKNLAWKNIEKNTIRIVMQKTSRILEIPLHESARKYLVQNDSEYVFPLIAVSKTNCIVYFTRWLRKAGIKKKIGWHTARRTFASIAVESGIDQYVISKLLGHTSIQTTSIYSQVPMPVKKQALDKFPSI